MDMFKMPSKPIYIVGSNLISIQRMIRIEHHAQIASIHLINHVEGVIAAINKLLSADVGSTATVRPAASIGYFGKRVATQFPSLISRSSKRLPAGDINENRSAPIRGIGR